MSGPPTEKQTAARRRNWSIRSIRALWVQAGILSADRAAAVRYLIDGELQAIGAEPEIVRRDRRAITEDEIPF
jgi:hypothetical protein